LRPGHAFTRTPWSAPQSESTRHCEHAGLVAYKDPCLCDPSPRNRTTRFTMPACARDSQTRQRGFQSIHVPTRFTDTMLCHSSGVASASLLYLRRAGDWLTRRSAPRTYRVSSSTAAVAWSALSTSATYVEPLLRRCAEQVRRNLGSACAFASTRTPLRLRRSCV